jgi:hypothetical protein
MLPCPTNPTEVLCFQCVWALYLWHGKCFIQGIMDIARPDLLQKRKRRLAAYVIAAVVLLGVGLVAVYRLKPAAPTVDRSTIWPDTVKRGPMIRQVRGSTGTLVPREDKLRLIPAETEATVTRILVLPGAHVEPNTVIMDLAYPQLEQEAMNASLALKAAESDYHNTQIKLQSDLMTQKAGAATVGADFSQAKLQAQTDKALYDLGVISGLKYNESKGKANELTTRNKIEDDRLAMNEKVIASQLAVEQTKVDQARALYQLKQQQLAAARDSRHQRRAGGSAASGGRARGARHHAGQGGSARSVEGLAQDRRDPGARHSDRPARLHRHAQRRDSRPRAAHRSGGAERNRHGGRRTHWASCRRARGPI